MALTPRVAFSHPRRISRERRRVHFSDHTGCELTLTHSGVPRMADTLVRSGGESDSIGCFLHVRGHCLEAAAIESSFAIVSGESCSAAAWRFSRRCLTEDVPGISRIFGAR
jgi:hypothetical protein